MNSGELATQIELFLLAEKDWVSVERLTAHFQFEERLLRADGDRRPLCRNFAISSSTKGLKHLAHTTVKERLTYKHFRLRVLIANKRALKEYDDALRNCTTGRPQIERHTGQLTLL